MSIMELGALGEFVAALAVLITLIFLTVQVRQARISSEANGTLQAIEWYGRWRTTLMQNSDLAAVLAKANTEQVLSEQELVQFQTIYEELFFVVAVSYANSSRVGSIHEASSEIDYLWEKLEASSAAVREWKRLRHLLARTSPELVAEIDHRLSLAAGDKSITEFPT